MAEFYNLEEAARVLGMSPEELQGQAQHRQVRAFMDAGTWRFRKNDVEELARRRGMGSDPDLSLSDLDLDIPPAGGHSGSESAELMLSEFQLGVATPSDVHSPITTEHKAGGPASDADMLLDEVNLPPGPLGGSSSTILGMTSGGKKPSDSDVKLVPDAHAHIGKFASDSDVRLAASPLKPSDSDVTLVSDDDKDSAYEIPNRARQGGTRIGPGSGSGSGSGSGDVVIGSSAELPPVADDDSDFELTPSSVIDALQPESGSDFELTAMDASDEFDATPLRGPGDSDVTGAEPSTSGINLGRPSDSGINLQGFSLDNDSIELAPLDEDPPARGGTKPMAKPTAKPAAPAAKKKDDLAATGFAKAPDLAATGIAKSPNLAATGFAKAPDLSATALPMKKKGDKDIFEDTDFEVDALDTGSSDDNTVQLEHGSDFDLDDSDSASEVFAVDEDDVDQNAATAMGPAQLDEDDEFSDVGEGASGESSAWDVEETTPSQVASASQGRQLIPGMAAKEVEWGGLWVGMLAVATVFMLLLAFVGMDLIRNMYDYHEGGPGSGLVKSIAGLM